MDTKILIGFRVDKEIREFFKFFANLEHRNFAGFITHGLLEYISNRHQIEYQPGIMKKLKKELNLRNLKR